MVDNLEDIRYRTNICSKIFLNCSYSYISYCSYFQVTYKALEQFSESEFDLDRLEVEVKKTRQSQNLDVLVSNTAGTSRYIINIFKANVTQNLTKNRLFPWKLLLRMSCSASHRKYWTRKRRKRSII